MKKVGLVTGASSGIGVELARLHAKSGGDLVLVARRKSLMENLKQELESNHGVKVLCLAIDLSTSTGPQEVNDFLETNAIQVEYLFNNAGFGGYGKFVERELAEDQRMIQLNIEALVVLTRLVLPGMVKRKHGYILNTASTAGFIPGPLQAVYFATKAFVVSFSKALSHELSGTGVSVTALCPGPVKTEFERVAGMEGSDLFKNSATALYTARKGYNAMIKRKRVIISDVKLAFALRFLLPFAPDKLILMAVERMQQIKNK